MTSPIVGISSARVSDLFVRNLVMSQSQYDQAQLLKLQTQLSTGHQFQVPSEDPTAAMQVIDLQRLLECKTQAQSNVSTNQAYLNATDSALSTVSGLLNDARGAAIGVMGTTATDQQRAAAAQQIDQDLAQFMATANQKFRGRYLFGGSAALQASPFTTTQAGFVQYSGNDKHLASYCDLDQLFDSNVTGNEAFGAISGGVVGTAELKPALAYDTHLSDLNGGRGVSQGSIAVSDGTQTSIVDLSHAATVGDVAALIRANPPAGRTVNVDLTGNGLVLSIDSAPANFSIKEVGGGSTAADLGILAPAGAGNNPIVGSDLAPTLRSTTPIADVFGVRARAALRFAGGDNDILVDAAAHGPDWNGVTVNLVDDPQITAGNEVAAYDAATKTLTVRVDKGYTEARQVVTAINTAHAAGNVPLTAQIDPADDQQGGHGLVDPSVSAVTSGGAGIEFDPSPGIQITNGDKTYAISFDGVQTVDDLLNRINQSGAGVLAEINATKNGIDVHSRLSGSDFMIGENGALVATQLGIRSFNGATRLDDLSFGRTADVFNQDTAGADFTITTQDGTALPVDVQGQQTIGGMIDLLNGLAPDKLQARLATYGNGIELVDLTAPPGSSAGVTITRTASHEAAVGLGLMSSDQLTVSATAPVYTGSDVHPLETEGVCTALQRLSQALRSNDQFTIQRAVSLLDSTTSQMNFVHAALGAQQQNLDATSTRLDDQNTQLQSVMSQSYDADLTEVVTKLTAQEATYQATLRVTAMLFNTSLLNYL